jgi:hypothetical protein
MCVCVREGDGDPRMWVVFGYKVDLLPSISISLSGGIVRDEVLSG